MIIGYARTSTVEQEAGLEAQERELQAHNCDRIFTERVSSVAPREQLDAAIDYLRPGDTLIVTKLDRLARSMADLVVLTAIIEEAKKGHLRVLDMGMDTSTASGKLMINVFGSVAQFEREIMLERQREGIAKAKAEGKYKGRAPTARRRAPEVLELHQQGIKPTAIARQLGIGRSSVFRILRGET